MKKQGLLFIISGPSGSGKTTLAEEILKQDALRGRIKKSISFTTRLKRLGELDRKDYFFIREEQFKELKQAKKILESTKYLGYYYGTPKPFVDSRLEKAGHILLCVDLKGVARLRRLYPQNSVTIFVMPPSISELRHRIEKRCDKITKGEIAKRLKLAEKEILAVDKFDYCIVNKHLGQAIRELKTVIINELHNN